MSPCKHIDFIVFTVYKESWVNGLPGTMYVPLPKHVLRYYFYARCPSLHFEMDTCTGKVVPVHISAHARRSTVPHVV